jgi:hypothetical protein
MSSSSAAAYSLRLFCHCRWTAIDPIRKQSTSATATTMVADSLATDPQAESRDVRHWPARVHSCNERMKKRSTAHAHHRAISNNDDAVPCGPFVDLSRALDARFADGIRGKKEAKDRLVVDRSARKMADDTGHQHMRRDRSLWELILATFLVAFLVGFVCVLCIGNYFRAKRAMERQRELRRRRASSATNNNGSNTTDSPRSLASESTANTDNNQNYNNQNNNERKYLLGGGLQQPPQRGPPELPRRRAGLLSGPSPSPMEDLLLFPDRGGDVGGNSNSEKPKIMRV